MAALDERTSRAIVDHTLTQALDTVFQQQQRIEELEEAMQRNSQYRRNPAAAGSSTARTKKRPRLQDMTPDELRAWLDSRRAALAAHSQFVQEYLDRRQHSGQHTRTDDQYNKFQELAADLLALLDELSQAAAEDQEEEPGP